MNDDIKNRLEKMNRAIRDCELRLGASGVQIDVHHGDLAWKVDDSSGNFRIMLGDRPLLGAKLKDRIENFSMITELENAAIGAMHALLDKYGL